MLLIVTTLLLEMLRVKSLAFNDVADVTGFPTFICFYAYPISGIVSHRIADKIVA